MNMSKLQLCARRLYRVFVRGYVSVSQCVSRLSRLFAREVDPRTPRVLHRVAALALLLVPAISFGADFMAMQSLTVPSAESHSLESTSAADSTSLLTASQYESQHKGDISGSCSNDAIERENGDADRNTEQVEVDAKPKTAKRVAEHSRTVEDSVYFANRNYRAIDMHLPCYLTTGLPLNKKPDAQTCDVKYQVSLKLNLFRNIAGKHWDLFVSYSQVSVWSLYARSSPFYDNSYAPGISAYHPVIKGNKLIGEMQMGIEHQSNGKDDETSRSFNYAYFTYAQHLGNFTVQAKLRAGFGYIEEDIRDMHRYYGFGHIAGTYRTTDGLFAAGVVVNPCDYFRKCNVTAEAFLRLGRNPHTPYFFVQYFYGLEMPRQFMPDSWTPSSMLRFGISIRPDKSNLY